MTASAPLPPGSVLGLVGGGQLGRMFAQAAARLGYRVHVLAPEDQPPAADVAWKHTACAYDDLDRARAFADAVDAVTYEFENIPADTVVALQEVAPVRPGPHILATTRNRIREKTFLRARGIPVTPFTPARSLEEARAAVAAFGGAAVLKTTELGYDGKGQALVGPDDDLQRVWRTLGDPVEVIVEQKIELVGECSVLMARDSQGRTVCYGPFYNTHRNHILDVTTWTADDDSVIAHKARAAGQRVADAFELEGLLCVELFMAGADALMVNEIAPRPHNSGHLTMEACSISQFEQQARLTAGQEAIAPVPRAPAAAMVNLLGDLWENGEPDWASVLRDPAVSLHLYGKTEARVGRKMGHLTVLGDTAEVARQVAVDARARLCRNA